MSKDPEVVVMPLAELRNLTEAIERVRKLHEPFEQTNENGYVHTLCAGCYDEDSGTGERFHDRYPCPTIQALDGEQ